MFELMTIDINFYTPIQQTIQKEYKREIELQTILKMNQKNNYDFWSKDELKQISKIDLSTPIQDDEDYSQW